MTVEGLFVCALSAFARNIVAAGCVRYEVPYVSLNVAVILQHFIVHSMHIQQSHYFQVLHKRCNV
jgi:hypothetical protein